mgnify:CR=1 FL=1
MPDEAPRCPFCQLLLFVRPEAGFAYIRTVISLHLNACAERPDDKSLADCVQIADDLAAKAVAELPLIV